MGDEAPCGSKPGRPSWSRDAWESAPCRSLESAPVAGLLWRRHRALPAVQRGPLSAPGAGGCMGDPAWSGMLASEPRRRLRANASLTSQRSGRRVQRACPLPRAWAGARPRSEEFSTGHLVFRKPPAQWKTFHETRVSRGLLPFGAGVWGRRESPAGPGRSPANWVESGELRVEARGQGRRPGQSRRGASGSVV